MAVLRRTIRGWAGLGRLIALIGGVFGSAYLAVAAATPCTYASLEEAVAAGGRVTLTCDGTLVFPRPLRVLTDTTLDASGHDLTFDGESRTRLFDVAPQAKLTLVGLRLVRGMAVGPRTNDLSAAVGEGGAIRVFQGTLIASNCVFATNVARGGSATNGSIARPLSGGLAFGGAIHARESTVRLVGCTLSDNRAEGPGSAQLEIRTAPSRLVNLGAGFGGAVSVVGSGTFEAIQTDFLRNRAEGGESAVTFGNAGEGRGGAVYADGVQVRLAACELTGNLAQGGSGPRDSVAGAARGGALANGPSGGMCLLEDSRFAENRAVAGSAWNPAEASGGAIFSQSTLRGVRLRLDANSAEGSTGVAAAEPARGGGVFAGGDTELVDCRINSNVARGHAPTLASGFAWRSADGWGGGVFAAGLVTIQGCAFTKNSARGGEGMATVPTLGDAGDGRGGALYGAGTVRMTNSTLVRNFAWGGSGSAAPGTGLGGGLFVAAGSLTGAHLTLRRNAAQGGEGLEFQDGVFVAISGRGVAGGLMVTNAASVRLYNSVIEHETSAENCAATFTDADHNLSSDRSCNFASHAGWDGVDPEFLTFSSYGGPTPTSPPSPDGPLVDQGNPAHCPATDQRGEARPFGFGCDLGAFELTELHRLTVTPSATAAGTAEMRFVGTPNQVGVLQGSADLRGWQALATNRTDARGRWLIPAVSTASPPFRFFRVAQPNP